MQRAIMRCLRMLCLNLALTLLWSWPALAASQEVTLPATLDYPFIRSLLISRVYTSPGQRVVLRDQWDCNRVEMWDPQTGAKGPRFRLRSKIKVRAGLHVLDKCVQPIDWQGTIELEQQVWLDPATLEVRFKTLGSALYDQEGEPAIVAGLIWNLIEKDVYRHLDKFSLNLGETLAYLKKHLPLLFSPAKRHEVAQWMKSLRPGRLRVEPQAIKIDFLVQVPEIPPAKPPSPAKPLTDQELDALIEHWEIFDAFLVHQIIALADHPLSDQDRATLLDILLEKRYGLLEALQEPADPQRDLVRQQFLSTWQALSPILRKYLGRQPHPSLLKFLSFFTASDALAALDKLGPALGLEISREGLMRMARLVDRGGVSEPLQYVYGVNPELRRALGLSPPLPDGRPRFQLPPKWEWPPRHGRSWLDWLVPTAWAQTTGAAQSDHVRKWLPGQPNPKAYLDRVNGLVRQAAEHALARGGLQAERNDLFFQLVHATAWQESCWRQFVIKQGQPAYLRSYNRSSVGLLQVNERIWRGLYDNQSLRWDIVYNARAGGEILELYLRRYALGRSKASQGFSDDLLARLVYAMYNGGPRQYHRFLQRQRSGRYYLSDKLFWQKYRWIKQGRLDLATSCFN